LKYAYVGISGEKCFVFVMITNPKPSDGIARQDTKGTMTTGYSDGLDVFFAVDAFEMQGGMKWIFCPQSIGFLCSGSDWGSELSIFFPERWQCL
jgi:hypothetical protein